VLGAEWPGVHRGHQFFREAENFGNRLRVCRGGFNAMRSGGDRLSSHQEGPADEIGQDFDGCPNACVRHWSSPVTLNCRAPRRASNQLPGLASTKLVAGYSIGMTIATDF
jgi:hypothetical protein